MGFFQSLKDDLSEAVSGLIPEGEQNNGDIEIRDIGTDEIDIEAAVLKEADAMEASFRREARKAERPAAVTRASALAAGKLNNTGPLPEIDLNSMLDNLDMDMDLPAEEAAEALPEEIPSEAALPETEFIPEAEPAAEAVPVQETESFPETEPVPEPETEPAAESEALPEENTEEEAPVQAEEKAGSIELSMAPIAEGRKEEAPQPSMTAARAREISKLRREEKKTMGETANRTISDETALIPVGMSVRGDIESDGSMDVYGSVTGNISIVGKLNVSGIITGNSSAKEVYADGAEINGDVKCEGSVKVGQSTVIIGNVSATSAVIAGAVKGDIDVHGPVILDSSAIVMGNIRSQSVQISNGAVVEGMCSQVYAAVNPSTFFEEFKKSTRQASV